MRGMKLNVITETNDDTLSVHVRLNLTLPRVMAGSPPEVMGKAVAIAIRKFPLVELHIERHRLIGYVSVPRDSSLEAFDKRVEELREEMARELGSPPDFDCGS
jgi:hypothetical protein